MAVKGSSGSGRIRSVHKRTCSGGNRPKTSAMNKNQKRTFKAYRGQGR
jgi:hypothetical protein